MFFVAWLSVGGLCVSGQCWCWSFWTLGDGGVWFGFDYLGALFGHETVGSVDAHVVGVGHAVLCFMYVFPVELQGLRVVEEYIACEKSKGSAFGCLWFVGDR